MVEALGGFADYAVDSSDDSPVPVAGVDRLFEARGEIRSRSSTLVGDSDLRIRNGILTSRAAIRETVNLTNTQRLRILYCDDQPRFLDDFARRHGDHFDIEPVGDISGVLPTLRDRKPEALPDLLLLDLYHDIDPSDQASAQTRIREANAALDQLDAAIERAKLKVDSAWRPVAVEIAEAIRQQFPSHVLPIMIYSQKGLFFLDDEQIRRIENAEVDWMLKDSSRFSAATEDARIRRVVERSRASQQMPRDIKVAAWSVSAGLAGSLLTLLVQTLLS